MTKRNHSRNLIAIAVLYTTGALGSGFEIRENSAEGLGRAFSGSGATPGEAALIYNNPAAMTLLDEPMAQVNLSAIDLSFDFQGQGSDAFGNPLSGDNGGDAGSLEAVPAAYFSTPLGDDWTAGVSLTAPFGLRTEYDEGWVGRYQSLRSELRTVNLALSVSHDVTDRFAVGASAILQHADATLSRAIDFGAILAQNPNVPDGAFVPQSADGKATLKGDDYAAGWSLGLLWRAGDRTNIGLSYRSEINHELSGDARFEVPAEVGAVFEQLPGNLFTDTGGRADLDTPAVATLSLHTELTDRFDLTADLSRTFWHAFDELRIRFDNPAQEPTVELQNWDDTWFASVGGEYRVNDRWQLRAGLGYDETPTNDTDRSPRVPDADRRWLSIGASWVPTQNWQFDAGYARLFTNETDIGNVAETGSTLQGTVDAETNLLSASATYRF